MVEASKLSLHIAAVAVLASFLSLAGCGGTKGIHR